MENKEFKCPYCGHTSKSEYHLKKHTDACKKNPNFSLEQRMENSVNHKLEEKTSEKTSEILQKTEREIMIEKAKDLVRTFGGSRIICSADVKLVFDMASYFAPGVAWGSPTCSACVLHAFNTIRANIAQS